MLLSEDISLTSKLSIILKLWFLSLITISIGNLLSENWSELNLNIELIVLRFELILLIGFITGNPKGVWIKIFVSIKLLLELPVTLISIWFNFFVTWVFNSYKGLILMFSIGRDDLVFSNSYKYLVNSALPLGFLNINLRFQVYRYPCIQDSWY